jgi:imidazolonepropionase-like amidohydrolase
LSLHLRNAGLDALDFLANRAGEIGVIVSGARADLIAVDGNPLADISLLDGQGEHITHIMKDGVFYKRRSPLSAPKIYWGD